MGHQYEGKGEATLNPLNAKVSPGQGKELGSLETLQGRNLATCLRQPLEAVDALLPNEAVEDPSEPLRNP
jgi:hypothetical protein